MALINNLNGMRTYLVGPMDRVPDGGVMWRDKITPTLEQMNVVVLNPCKKQVQNIKEDQQTRQKIQHYKDTKQFDKIRQEYGKIRNVDLRCVDISDFIIAHVDINVHMCGSYEEIVTANRQKKPILIWCEQGKSKAPNWLFFMMPHENIFDSMDELLSHLYDINERNNIQNLYRWLFFEDLK